MRGKAKCKILREIRQKIAEENDIELITKECTYQGECKGTCPRCEAEVRFLERELARKQQLGKAVTVAALAASLTVGLTACVSQPLAGEVERETTEPSVTQTMGLVPNTELEGDPVEQPSETEGQRASVLPGEATEPSAETPGLEFYELEGNVAIQFEPLTTETTDVP